MTESVLRDIAAKFNINEPISAYGNGHINDTYLIPSAPGYILQRINHNVFKKPEDVMSNILLVTEHLKKKILSAGGDILRETLTVVKTTDGKPFYRDENGNYYRMYLYIDDAKSFEQVEKPEHFYSAARAFGKFQKLLSDFAAHKLYETIPNFHNTDVRFNDLLDAIEQDKMGRRQEVAAEIEFALARKADTGIVTNLLKTGILPLRVTHNDTKYNNLLIDNKTGKAICVIDLDTVMPGSLLYDYGDSLRFGTNPADEDEPDLDKVYCDLTLFEQFTKGFIEEMKDTLTKKEIELMPFSARLMTYECGIRFLTDYLNGDVYFKIKDKYHNLRRTRTQFKLVSDMEGKAEKMDEIVKKYNKLT